MKLLSPCIKRRKKIVLPTNINMFSKSISLIILLAAIIACHITHGRVRVARSPDTSMGVDIPDNSANYEQGKEDLDQRTEEDYETWNAEAKEVEEEYQAPDPDQTGEAYDKEKEYQEEQSEEYKNEGNETYNANKDNAEEHRESTEEHYGSDEENREDPSAAAEHYGEKYEKYEEKEEQDLREDQDKVQTYEEAEPPTFYYESDRSY